MQLPLCQKHQMYVAFLQSSHEVFNVSMQIFSTQRSKDKLDAKYVIVLGNLKLLSKVGLVFSWEMANEGLLMD